MSKHTAIRDHCAFCLGAKGGVGGNENVYHGVVVCDYCSVLLARALPAWSDLLAACKAVLVWYNRGGDDRDVMWQVTEAIKGAEGS